MGETEQAVFNEHLKDHALTLGTFIQASMSVVEPAMRPTVYVQDEDGNQATFARLVERTLTDGSRVWNLVLTFGEG